MLYTPKQRMLNAYRGIFSDRYPVAPEFWYYYPAKVLGVDMITFLKEIPLWKALQITFKKYGTEGWGIVSAESVNPDSEATSSSDYKKISGGRYLSSEKILFRGKEFTSSVMYDQEEPPWVVEPFVKEEKDLDLFVEWALLGNITYSFEKAVKAYNEVGEDYLLEFSVGDPFFDFIAAAMGFEKAIMYFMNNNDSILERYQKRFIEHKIRLIRKVCWETPFESLFIGCNYSCLSLIGPRLWRKWDKLFIKSIADEVHKNGKLLHVHFHGKSIETARDFAEIGIDCVCPFERPPGGDIEGSKGLRQLRKLLDEKVTMNGNVHTVETLIRGKPADVRREVKEIKEAFEECPSLIIGTGDQVGKETSEENIWAMIEAVKE